MATPMTKQTLRALAEEKVRATVTALKAEAKARGLKVGSVDGYTLCIADMKIDVRPCMTTDRFFSKPTGKIAATVYGIEGYWRQAFPTKTFPEGKAGVNIGKVLDRVAAEKKQAAAEERFGAFRGMVAKWQEQASQAASEMNNYTGDETISTLAERLTLCERHADELAAVIAAQEAK